MGERLESKCDEAVPLGYAGRRGHGGARFTDYKHGLCLERTAKRPQQEGADAKVADVRMNDHTKNLRHPIGGAANIGESGSRTNHSAIQFPDLPPHGAILDHPGYPFRIEHLWKWVMVAGCAPVVRPIRNGK